MFRVILVIGFLCFGILLVLMFSCWNSLGWLRVVLFVVVCVIMLNFWCL